jgi:long-chain acyl-CoA synthetase
MLYNLLARQAKLYADKTAIVDEFRTISFAQLFEKASATASYLQAEGYGAGESILIGVPPSIDFYIAFYAAAALGLVILPVLPSGRIPQAIVERQPKLAVGEPKFLEEAQCHTGTIVRSIPWSRDTGLHIPISQVRLQRAQSFRNECALGVSSSGSTGTPSLYYRSQALLVNRGKLRAQVLAITADDVLLATRPFNSGSSINTHVITPLVAGCKVVVQERFRRLEAAETIGRERVTVLYAVPYIFELLATIPADYPVDLSSLRVCISGGAALAESVAASFFRRFDIELQQLYGGSHIHPAFTCNLGNIRGAVGQTFGPFPIEILDENRTPLEPGSIGEIAFDYTRATRPWKKYLRENPNRRGRYLLTGDLGRADENGNVFVVGRKSSFIKVRGNRVEPAEVEAVLRSHPAVQEAFVYPTDRGKPSEAVGAIVCTEGVSELDLLRHCAQRLDGYKCPRTIEFRTSLPRNSHGKLARSLLEEEIAIRQES